MEAVDNYNRTKSCITRSMGGIYMVNIIAVVLGAVANASCKVGHIAVLRPQILFRNQVRGRDIDEKILVLLKNRSVQSWTAHDEQAPMPCAQPYVYPEPCSLHMDAPSHNDHSMQCKSRTPT